MPRVINVDQNRAYPAACRALKAEGVLLGYEQDSRKIGHKDDSHTAFVRQERIGTMLKAAKVLRTGHFGTDQDSPVSVCRRVS